MRSLIIILLSLLNALAIIAQDPVLSDSIEVDWSLQNSQIDIVDPIETMPVFPGGDDSLWCFLEKMIDFSIINEKELSGKVVIQFTIDTLGYTKNVISNPSFLNVSSIGNSLVRNREVVDTIESTFAKLPKWKPGEQLGYKVPVLMTFVIKIPYEDYRCRN